jgi:serine/threonine protein kinase
MSPRMQHEDIRIGDRIGGFRVVGALAGGGYRGLHEQDGRRVHIDVKARHVRWRDATMQVIETTRMLESLRHPGIARVVDRGVLPDHRPWFAVEVPSGIGLFELIARRPLPPPEVATLVHDLAGVLAYAHARGIVHGALTLRGIVFATGAREFPMCITDWGFAPADLGVFAPPEANLGATPADIFGLGVIAYRAATQAFPVPPIRDVPRLPPSLAELIVRMLALDPLHRPTAPEIVTLTSGDDRVHVTPGPRFGKPKWTPAPPITSEATSVAAGEIPDKRDR